MFRLSLLRAGKHAGGGAARPSRGSGDPGCRPRCYPRRASRGAPSPCPGHRHARSIRAHCLTQLVWCCGRRRYAALRQPILDEFKRVQMQAKMLVDLTQGLADRLYEHIPEPVAKVKALNQDDLCACCQPVPDEFLGADFDEFLPSPSTKEVCDKAVRLIASHRDHGTLSRLYITDDEAAFLCNDLPKYGEECDDKVYYAYLMAKMVLHSERFHTLLESCLGALAAITHQFMKTVSTRHADTRTCAAPRPLWQGRRGCGLCLCVCARACEGVGCVCVW